MLGHTFLYAYDKAGNLIQSAAQRSGVLNYVYDKIGHIQEARNSQTCCSETKNYWFIAGLSAVAVVAIVSPLDGPLGDAATIGALSGALSQ